MQVPMSGAFDTTVSKVEIRISCRNLIRLDVLSESDPLVRVEQFDPTTGRWSEVGRTEWQQNQKNPNFARCVPMDYWFEKVQKLRFQVFDIDRPDSSLNSSQDFVGEAVVNLGDILGNKGGTLSRDLQNPHHTSRKNGIIIIRAEEVNADAQNSIVTFRFSGSHLDKKDFFGKSDPYLEIYRNNPADSQWVLVHKTEVIKKTLDPTWRPFEIDASKLCQGDFNRMLMFKVWDWDSDGGHDLIGNATTTLNEMIKGKRQFALIEPDLMRKKRGYKDSGILNVHQVDVRRVHSFLEYIAGGCQLRLALAIDFTASNGNPQDSKSLHYRNPSGEPNEYLKAMMAVGDIVASYDQTKQFPTYGFGAKIPPANEVSHCFHVNMNPSNPECIGIENVIGAYQHALSYVKLSGPTNFGPIIKQVATIARSTPLQQQVYWILLMITDGVISDMERTISEIVDASDLPFSIIIVGVGDADFKDMDNLDSDDRLLRTRTGKTATRDIVQFVPFRDYKRKHYSELARVTLAELPKQLTDYYKAHNIAPNPRPDVPMTQAGLQIPLTQAGLHVPSGGVAGLAPGQGGVQGVPPPQIPQSQGQWGGQPQGGFPGGPPPQSQGQWGGPQGGPPQGQWGGPQGGPPQGQWGGPQQAAGGGYPQGGPQGYPAGGPQGGPPPQSQGQWGAGPQGGPPQGGPAYPQQAGDRQSPAGPAAGPVTGGPQQGGYPAGGPAGGPTGQSGYPAGGPAGGPQQSGYPAGGPAGGPTGQSGYPAGGPAGGPQQSGYPAGGAAAGGPTGGPQGYPVGGQGGFPAGPAGGPQQSGYPAGGAAAGGPTGGPQGYPVAGPQQQGGWGGPQQQQQGGAPPAGAGSPHGSGTGYAPLGGGPAVPAQGDAAKQGDSSAAAGGPTGSGGASGQPQSQQQPPQGGWGGPQQQQQGGYPPQQGGWGGPQQQGGWGGPQQQQQGGWGGPQQQWGGPQQQQGGWGGAPQQQWGGQQQQWGGPQQQQGGWGGAPQQQGGWGGPQQQWGGPQQQQQWGGPQQGGWGGPQQQGGWGGPQQQAPSAAPTGGAAPQAGGPPKQ